MKILKLLLIALSFTALFACEDEKHVDMSKLKDYYFEFSDVFEYENDHDVKNDTIIYSFESEDSVIAIRYYYEELANGTNEFIRCDTINRTYYIDNNYITFGTEWYTISVIDYLMEFKWEVVSIDDEALKIKLHSNYAPTGNTILKSIPK